MASIAAGYGATAALARRSRQRLASNPIATEHTDAFIYFCENKIHDDAVIVAPNCKRCEGLATPLGFGNPGGRSGWCARLGDEPSSTKHLRGRCGMRATIQAGL
jgi:hypothetical protein